MADEEIAAGMRKCPFCAEIIRIEAKICRFCQRDLPDADAPEDKSVDGEDSLAIARPLRHGDRVSSPIMGDGMVVGSGLYRGAVLVVFDRDHIQRRVPPGELRLIPKPEAISSTEPVDRPNDTLIMAAWLTAFLFPLIGFVCGVVLLSKDEVGHGVGSMVASIVMFIIWLVVFSSFA
jgi:hypothetical protein